MVTRILLILSVVLTAFSVTIYQLTKSNLLTEIDTDVRQRATMLRLVTHPYPQETTLHVPKLDVFASPDIYLQVLDQRGRVLASSGNLGNRTFPLMRDAIAADQVREARVGSTLLFVYGQAVLVHHKLLGYVLVACSPRRIYFALDRLLHILIPGVIVALVLAGIAIWLLVHQAMHPLVRLATTAADIAAAQDHSRRLSPQGPPDEINRLVLYNDNHTARAQTNKQKCWGEDSRLIFLEEIGRTNHDERRRDEQICCPR